MSEETNPLSVSNLTIGYPTRIMGRHISFDLVAAKSTALIGPNGSGKSTLIKTLLGLLPPFRGEVNYFGKQLNLVREKVAYVPQRSTLDLTFPISAFETVLLGTYPRRGRIRPVKKADRSAALDSLARVGLKDFGKAPLATLSGGQLQRVFIARALVQRPEVIILDEPLTGVDHASEKIIIDELKRLTELGATVLAVHHNLATVSKYFDNVLLFNRGLVADGSAREVVNSSEWNRVFGLTKSI